MENGKIFSIEMILHLYKQYICTIIPFKWKEIHWIVEKQVFRFYKCIQKIRFFDIDRVSPEFYCYSIVHCTKQKHSVSGTSDATDEMIW